MSWIVFPGAATGTFGFEGTIVKYVAGDPTSGVELSYPSTINAIDERPIAFNYANRMYFTGFTENMMMDEHYRVYRQGIQKPNLIPTITAASGPGPTGNAVIGYISYYDAGTNERSSLSAPSTTIAISNQSITWTNLPTTSNDARVTHLEFWRSVDGGAIRFVSRRDLGVTTLNENIATLALGEVAPDLFEQFPPCRGNAIYHDRQFLFGDGDNADTIYASELFFPERYGGLNFKTRNGEAVVALAPVRDQLLVLCANSSYVLQGYQDDDYTMEISEPDLGCLGAHGWCQAHGNLYIANNQSFFMYDGSWHNTLKWGQLEYRLAYESNQLAFERSYMYHDPIRNVVKLVINMTEMPDTDIPTGYGTLAWTASYIPVLPEVGGTYAEPIWSFDARTRQDKHSALLRVPGGARGDIYTGSNDGFIRRENLAADSNDQEDTYGKRFELRTRHIWMAGRAGGDAEEGKTFHKIWVHMESENNGWTIYVLAGDEKCYKQLPPDNTIYFWGDDVDASLLTRIISSTTYTYVPLGYHTFYPEMVSGRGLTLRIFAINPVGVLFRGFGGWYTNGPATRTIVSAQGGA